MNIEDLRTALCKINAEVKKMNLIPLILVAASALEAPANMTNVLTETEWECKIGTSTYDTLDGYSRFVYVTPGISQLAAQCEYPDGDPDEPCFYWGFQEFAGTDGMYGYMSQVTVTPDSGDSTKDILSWSYKIRIPTSGTQPAPLSLVLRSGSDYYVAFSSGSATTSWSSTGPVNSSNTNFFKVNALTKKTTSTNPVFNGSNTYELGFAYYTNATVNVSSYAYIDTLVVDLN